jgi:hypothetical protein
MLSQVLLHQKLAQNQLILSRPGSLALLLE